jgi:hypothetical protein
MQVIIFGERGAFKHLNGRTVKAAEVNTSFFVVKADGQTIDVPLKNALIVNFHALYTKAQEEINENNIVWIDFYRALKAWADIHAVTVIF